MKTHKPTLPHVKQNAARRTTLHPYHSQGDSGLQDVADFLKAEAHGVGNPGLRFYGLELLHVDASLQVASGLFLGCCSGLAVEVLIQDRLHAAPF